MAGRLVNDAGAAVPSSDFRVPRYGGADDRSIQCALSRSGGRGAGGRGPPPPLSEPVAQEYATHGVRLTAVYSNCSGKHAGMLALARHHDWPTQFYTRLEHPVQQRCLAEVSRWTDVPAGAVKTAVGGCGGGWFGLALKDMGGGGGGGGRGRARTGGGARDGGGARGAGVEAPAGVAGGAAQREYARRNRRRVAGKWGTLKMKGWGRGERGDVL